MQTKTKLKDDILRRVICQMHTFNFASEIMFDAN